MPRRTGGSADPTDSTGTRAQARCDTCDHLVPKANLSVHRATCQARRRAHEQGEGEAPAGAPAQVPRGGALASSGGRPRGDGGGDDVSLLTAYALWFFLGFLGIHHAYLNRPYQALGWCATLGLCGWGWIRDALFIPRYVALARDDRTNEVTARVRAATVEARGGVPKVSLIRVAVMGVFGRYFGFLASCLVSLPEEGAAAPWAGAVYGTLRAVGSAAGVWLVGNMGEETLRMRGSSDGDGVDGYGARDAFVRLLACCLAGLVLLDRPVLGGIYFAVRHRRYRPSMRPKTSSGPAKRVGRHILSCAIFTALLAIAAYNHGSIVVNDQRIYLHEAIRNAIHSEFWKEFDFDEFRSNFNFRESSSSGGQGRGGGSEYLKRTFDVQGERSARRTLGVARDAPHSEVRAAYKKLALKYHPDKIGPDVTEKEAEEARRMFVRVQEAYEVLNGIEQRRKRREAPREEHSDAVGTTTSSRGSGYSRREGSHGYRDEM